MYTKYMQNVQNKFHMLLLSLQMEYFFNTGKGFSWHRPLRRNPFISTPLCSFLHSFQNNSTGYSIAANSCIWFYCLAYRAENLKNKKSQTSYLTPHT